MVSLSTITHKPHPSWNGPAKMSWIRLRPFWRKKNDLPDCFSSQTTQTSIGLWVVYRVFSFISFFQITFFVFFLSFFFPNYILLSTYIRLPFIFICSVFITSCFAFSNGFRPGRVIFLDTFRSRLYFSLAKWFDSALRFSSITSEGDKVNITDEVGPQSIFFY